MKLSKIYRKLRQNSKGQYLLLGFCIFLSVLLITSFTLMYYGPTVQNFLPEGGDTRKMASLLIGVTAVGCFIFTVYASGLFFRHKSREYGIMMALGLPKKELKKLLFGELSAVTALSCLLGLAAAVPVSWIIWKIFELFIISNEQMTYRFGGGGFLSGILFSVVLALALGLAGRRFVSRSDIMEILRTQQKSEMVREIGSWTFPAGVILTVAGILLGSGLPQFFARVLDISLPGIVNLVYLLSVVGIYLILLSIVAQSRVKKNKKKYYKNLVSISLMRFSARAATRNMCVSVLLLFACCFSAFYGMQYSLAPDILNAATGKTFSMHYPVLEDQIKKEDIVKTAGRYGQEVEDYSENEGANLVISYDARDFNEEGTRYLEVYKDRERTALFVSASDYQVISGQNVSVKPGTYQTVTPADYREAFDYVDGLKEVTNPDTGESWNVKFGGQLECDVLASMSEPFAYVLSNEDYQTMTAGISREYMEQMVFFNVSDVENSYDFAMDLLSQYVDHATDLSNHLGYWNIWEQKMADEAGEPYMYGDRIDMTMDNNMLLGDWKFAPSFNIITVQDRMQLISVYVMLSLYICLISLAAISIMSYVRSISVASDNKELFESLRKLGADKKYQRMVLKKQLARIFQYPAALGCGLGFLFSLAMDLFNDGRLSGTEVQALIILLGIILLVAVVLYMVYRYSRKRAEMIEGI
ncbi:MAG: FtsX-like permease family protein [Ruminococcus sp.]|jgi:putative ABC transport system permease protein